MSESRSHEHETALREIPSTDAVLRHATVAPLLDEHPRSEVMSAVRAVLNTVRASLLNGESADVSIPRLALEIRAVLHRRGVPSLRGVINATGIVLHTGLGRAPLAEEAIEAVAEVARGYCNLELDLTSGERGDRHIHCRDLLRELTGAEDVLVVNNNAAATMLALRALACEREVLISRGQIVEIGGAYRMPDIMGAAGCRMVEVGTTNRTRIADYERAFSEKTAAVIRVHTSNYRMIGFVAEPTIDELVEFARRCGQPRPLIIDDLGSGWLVSGEGDGADIRAPAGWDEPSVRDSVQAGADVCMFSGDKLLGGPQAGILVGSTACISAARRDPLARVVRPDKLTLAALEATLRLYRDPNSLVRKLPAMRMLCAGAPELEITARQIAARIASDVGEFACEVAPDSSYAGGGSLPALKLPTWTVRLRHPRITMSALARGLREGDQPVVARIQGECVVLDCRTIASEEVGSIIAALGAALRELLEA